jgi:hypothetical protein
VLQLSEKIKEFCEVDIDALWHRDLRSWARWGDSIELLLERASDSIASARTLLEVDNLRQVNGLLSSAEASQFAKWLRSVEVGN